MKTGVSCSRRSSTGLSAIYIIYIGIVLSFMTWTNQSYGSLACESAFDHARSQVVDSPLNRSLNKSNLEFSNLIDYQARYLDSLINTIDRRSSAIYRPPMNVELKIRATRNDFLDTLYANSLVTADDLSLALSDKMIVADLLKHYIGPRYTDYHPKTSGLVSFLAENNLIDPVTGAIQATRDELLSAFQQVFPIGFIVKPTTGWSSKGRNFFKDRNEIVELLLKEDPSLYNRDHYIQPFSSDAVNATLSGERFIIQARLGMSEGLKPKNSEMTVLREYRTHSLWGQFVPQATKGRWIGAKPSKESKSHIAAFLQDFLDSLPKGLRQGQAWSFDVLETGTNSYAIVEVNTNRGAKGHWSGSLHNPTIIGAYVRHIEKQYGWKFKSISGVLLRKNMANRKRWVQHQKATRESHNGN